MEERPLTREELRDELRCFAQGVLQQDDVSDIVSRVREQVREELRHCFLEWLPRGAGSPATRPAPEDFGGELSLGIRALPQQRLDVLAGCGQEDLSPVSPACCEDSQADTEASPRPALRLAKESPHGGMPPRLSSRLARLTGAVRPGRAKSDEPVRAKSDGALPSSQATTSEGWKPEQTGPIHDTSGFFQRHYQKFLPGGRQLTGPRGAAPAARSSKHSAMRNSIVSQHAPKIQPQETGGPIKRLVASPLFDYVTGLLILLNAGLIGFQTDYQARNNSTALPPAIRGLELFFCVAFTLELLLRMLALKVRFFCALDWKWNIFDCLLVGLQLAEELMGILFQAESTGGGGGVNTDVSSLRILRILRLIRIIRLVRILRLIGELRTIVVSIIGSLRSLCWTVLLLMMMMYLLGVYMTQLILDDRLDKKLTTANMTTAQAQLDHFFGSLGMAIISLYQAITGGINWHTMADPLMGQISPWLAVLLGLYIAFSLFALMNVVTGVFVESALATAKKDKDNFLMQFVQKLFVEADKDASGAITWDEFKACLDSQEMKLYFEALDLDIHEAKNLFRLLDIDGSGQVEFEEFVNGCFRLRGPAKALDLATFMSGFRLWNNEWMKFATRVDWQLKTLLAYNHLSMKDAPKFRARSTSARAPGGMALITPENSEDGDVDEDDPSASVAPKSSDGNDGFASEGTGTVTGGKEQRLRMSRGAFYESEEDMSEIGI